MNARTAVLAGTWVVDAAATTAAFRATGVCYPVRGTVPVDAGRVEIGGSGRPLSVDVVLDATRIDTGNARRDKDLRSPRFLGTDAHPVIRFSTQKVSASPDGWTVDGILSAAGGQCPVTLDVRLAAGSPEDGECRVTATGTVDRADLGIAVPAILVRRRVRLEIDALMRRA